MHTCLSRGVPADHEAQSQVKRKTLARRGVTLTRPHPEERRDLAEFKSVGTPANRTDREKKVVGTRQGKERATVTREAQCGSVRNAQHMKQKISVREVRRRRETRASMTAQQCWTNQRIITPWPEAAMKTLTGRVDTAQSSTHWCWRSPTRRRGNESPGPDGVKPDLTNSRPRCCKRRC